MANRAFLYGIVPTPVGQTAIVWASQGEKRIVRIFLPQRNLGRTLREAYPDSIAATEEDSGDIRQMIRSFFEGRPFRADHPRLDPACYYGFQKTVLMETAAIACGKVMSYGDVARKILAPGAQRAVGTALGRNPFPLIIPCHRVIRSDGSLGGFGGGLALKLELLQLEGVEFDEKGRVKKKCMVK